MDLMQITTIAKDLGYSGQELRDFVNTQIEKQEAKEKERIEREEKAKAKEDEKEKERIEREEKAKAKEDEKEKERIERDERAKEREDAKEKERIEREQKYKEEEHKRILEQKEKEIEIMKLKKSMEVERKQENQSQGQIPIYRPKLPKFDEDKDDLDAYLERFERFAQVQQWKKEEWAVCLSPLLTGKGLQVFTGMPANDVNDYEKLKQALLRRYQLTEEGFRKRFREGTADSGETVYQFISRIRRYLQRWVELSGVEKSFDGLQNLLIKEQYLQTCGKDLEIFLRERAPKTVEELTTLAEQYNAAHGGYDLDKVETDKSDTVQAAGARHQHDTTRSFGERRCYICNRSNHIARDCHYRGSYREAWRSSDSNQMEQHPEPEDNEINSDQTAGFSVQSTKTKDNEKSGRMPVTEGRVNNKKVSVLRDTGCSSAAVRTSLVETHQRTGRETTCLLIDGTERKFPVARIHVSTPYFTGYTDAMCMENPLYDLIIGNVHGSYKPDLRWPEEGNALVIKTQDRTIQSRKKEIFRHSFNGNPGSTRKQKLVPQWFRRSVSKSDRQTGAGVNWRILESRNRSNSSLAWPGAPTDTCEQFQRAASRQSKTYRKSELRYWGGRQTCYKT
jgi:hypothetical protein